MEEDEGPLLTAFDGVTKEGKVLSQSPNEDLERSS
jgi:hypothetical protein